MCRYMFEPIMCSSSGSPNTSRSKSRLLTSFRAHSETQGVNLDCKESLKLWF